MKEITVYQTDNAQGLQDIYLNKSAALAAEARQAAFDTAKRLIDSKFSHTQNHETTAKALTLLIEQAISPGKLARAYRRLWKIRKAVQAALAEETIKEEEPPF